MVLARLDALCLFFFFTGVTRGASDKQKERWREWYKTLDINHDNVLSGKDRDINIQRHLAANNLDTDSEAAKKLAIFWNTCVLMGNDGERTPGKHVAIHNAELKRLGGTEAYRNNMYECVLHVFQACDSDGDGYFNEAEYRQIYEDFGHHSLAVDHEAFQAYSPVNGKVPLKSLVHAWTDYIVVPDNRISHLLAEDGME